MLKCSAVTFPDRRGTGNFSNITKVLFWLFTSTFWEMNICFGVGGTYFALNLAADSSFNRKLFFNELSNYLHRCPDDVIFLHRWKKQMLMYSLMISENMLLNGRAVICRLHSIPLDFQA